MEIAEEIRGRVTIVSARGRLDGETSSLFGERLQQLASKPEPRLLIDLSGVSFIASAGLRVVMAALKKVHAGKGDLAVCAVKGPVREVLDITGFTTLLRVFPERATALKHLSMSEV
jgi:anti-anti-sigma factor